MIINGRNYETAFWLRSMMEFYCFLTGSVGSETRPAARKILLVSCLMAGDTCIPLYAAISYDRNVNHSAYVSARACVQNIRSDRREGRDRTSIFAAGVAHGAAEQTDCIKTACVVLSLTLE